ncbi:fumarylacetoacetate hydrolase family protein [Bordetella trematum]|uniref:fumarylacetoacetate hydrolase family protein n=1 Tax=Bordetella trematum TaxID=123899 RepID=UPI001559524C|nr:fumarylacetoacetate hydrolase family protein [Bordetella trematum]
MKLLTFAHDDSIRLGALLDDGKVIDLTQAWSQHPHALSQSPAPRQAGDIIDLGDAAIAALDSLLEQAQASGRPQAVEAAGLTILAPIPRPRKNIFCVGRNYRAHIVEGNLARGQPADQMPKAMEIFSKPPTAVSGHNARVSRHGQISKLLDYEIELGIVIGKAGRDIRPEDALDHVFGYTIVNDITARDLQALHGQWFKGKSLDGTCPIGPVITLARAIPAPNALSLELEVNGEKRQSANTSDMLFDIPAIIAILSQGMTLEPGDIIATGTPSGVGLSFKPPRSLEAGDIIKARIESIGELVTHIV